MIIAGATPNETISDKLSYSAPNLLEVFVNLATRPSRPSIHNAIKIEIAAISNLPFIACKIEKNPKKSAAVVIRFGNR